MYEQIMLRAQFMDRAGRLVYLATPVRMLEPEGRNDVRQLEEGPPFAQVRMKPGEDGEATVEWMELPSAPAPAPAPATPGPDFLPGQVPNPEDPGPHSGGTG